MAAPLAIGGGRPWAQVALCAGAVVAAVAWLFTRRGDLLRLPPFTGVASLALAVTLVQLVPLPAGLVEWLSPRALELRTDALGGRPALLPLTLDVPATLLAAARGLACLAVLVVTAAATRRGKVHFFVVPLALTAGLVATLSFAQRAAGAETILGFYQVTDLPGSGFFGTFISGNHAASFFTLGALLGLGAIREIDGPVRWVLTASSILCVAGLFSTMSRFGLIGAAAGGFALFTLWLVRLFGTWRGILISAGASVVAGPLAVALALGNRGGAWSNVSLVGSLNDFKIRGWSDALDLAIRFPLVGVGRGAFEAPATAFRDNAEGVRLIFPENLLLQLATEFGLPVSIALIGLFVWAALPIVRRVSRWEPIYQAAASAVVAILVHDLADFGLEVLGVALPTVMVLGICAGRRQMSLDAAAPAKAGGAPAPRARFSPAAVTAATVAVVGGAVLAVGGAAWAAERTADADASRIRVAIASKSSSTDALLTAAIARHPADHDFPLLAARWAMRSVPPESSALRHLNRAQRLYPAAFAPHVFAAHLLVQLGKGSQAAIELRLANELGANLSYQRMEQLVGTAQLERAIPREPDGLFRLADYLVSVGRVAAARAATTRALYFADSAESSLIRRTQIALRSGDKAFIDEAATALARAPSSAEAVELAIRGLATTGKLVEARALLRQVPTLLPHETGLTVKGARVLMEHKDLVTARTVLVESAVRNLPFADRLASEELLAEIAEREGDPHAAAAARARARLLVHMRGDSHAP